MLIYVIYNNLHVYGIKIFVVYILVPILKLLKAVNLFITHFKKEILHYVNGIIRIRHVLHHKLQMKLHQHTKILIAMLKLIIPIIMMVIIVFNVMLNYIF